MRPRFKVCCIRDADEAHRAIDAGAALLGLVSSMPSGPGVIGDQEIAAIAQAIPPGVESVVLTSLTDPDAVVDQHRHVRTSAIQLVDELPAGALGDLRAALPGIRLIQVIHVVDATAVDQAVRAARDGAHAILLDSGNPALAVKELGGTGRRHDWAISAEVVRRVAPVPVLLAGGLRPGNAAEALAAVRPWALDVCSGLRDGGFALRDEPLRAFAAEVAAAAG